MSIKRFNLLVIVLIVISALLGACSKGVASGVQPDAIFAAEDYDGKLAINFFHMEPENKSIKSGESFLIKTPKGKTILIDAGIPEVGPVVDDYLDKLDIDKIDLVMPSHPHSDHIGGLPTIFKAKEIGKVLETNVPDDSKAYEKYKQIMKEEDIESGYVEDGDVLELEEDLVLEVLNPPKGTSGDSLPEEYSDMGASPINNASEVLKLTYKNRTFLFTGDLYRAGEKELIERHGAELDVDVLGVPHHGDGTSSSMDFIETVDPEIALIPSNNIYNIGVYERYSDYGSDVYHSVLDGNILLVSDGEEIDIITEKERESDLLD